MMCPQVKMQLSLQILLFDLPATLEQLHERYQGISTSTPQLSRLICGTCPGCPQIHCDKDYSQIV